MVHIFLWKRTLSYVFDCNDPYFRSLPRHQRMCLQIQHLRQTRNALHQHRRILQMCLQIRIPTLQRQMYRYVWYVLTLGVSVRLISITSDISIRLIRFKQAFYNYLLSWECIYAIADDFIGCLTVDGKRTFRQRQTGNDWVMAIN